MAPSSFSIAYTGGEKWFVLRGLVLLGGINRCWLLLGGGLAFKRQGNPICTDDFSV